MDKTKQKDNVASSLDNKHAHIEGKINYDDLNKVLNSKNNNEVLIYNNPSKESRYQRVDNPSDLKDSDGELDLFKEPTNNQKAKSFNPKERFKSSIGLAIILAINTFFIMFCVYLQPYENKYIAKSTVDREKIVNTIPYNRDCVKDEIGYVSSTNSLARNIQPFYDKTGIQPYIYLKSSTSSLSSDKEKEAFAKNWYKKNIKDENSFLLVYFESKSSNDFGYLTYISGKNTKKVLDQEAINIFKDYIDYYWLDKGTNSNESAIKSVYTFTANTIMKKEMTSLERTIISLSGATTVFILIIGYNYIVMKKQLSQQISQQNNSNNVTKNNQDNQNNQNNKEKGLLDKYFRK